MYALPLMAWQCLAPDHQHVLFNNVGIFYCFAFITVKEAEAENRNRTPVALKPEVYRSTTVGGNISISIQGWLFPPTGCLLKSVIFLYRSLKECIFFSILYFLFPFFCIPQYTKQLHCWPPICNRVHGNSGSRDLGCRGLVAKGCRGVFGSRDEKYGSSIWATRTEGKEKEGGKEGREIYSCSLASWPVHRPMYQKDHHVWDEHECQFMTECSTQEILWVGKCKDHVEKRKIFLK